MGAGPFRRNIGREFTSQDNEPLVMFASHALYSSLTPAGTVKSDGVELPRTTLMHNFAGRHGVAG